MKGKELIAFIKENNLEECDVYQDEYEEIEIPVECVAIATVYGEKSIVINRCQ